MLGAEFGVLTFAVGLLLHSFLFSHALALPPDQDDDATTTTLEPITQLPPQLKSAFSADDEFFYFNNPANEEGKSANRTAWWRQSFLPIRQSNRRCVCEDFTCGCCAGMALQRINISRVGKTELLF
jgi:hypothetical protein